MPLPSLKEVLGLVGGLQPEDVLLLRVISGLGCERMMYPDGVVEVVAHLVLPEAVLVLVKVEDKVAQRTVEHLPTALVKWG